MTEQLFQTLEEWSLEREAQTDIEEAVAQLSGLPNAAYALVKQVLAAVDAERKLHLRLEDIRDELLYCVVENKNSTEEISRAIRQFFKRCLVH